jgi:hypothetical protein
MESCYRRAKFNRGTGNMDAFDDAITIDGADESAERPDADVAALWLALAADRRARDERTARLRAMRLIGGDDETL